MAKLVCDPFTTEQMLQMDRKEIQEIIKGKKEIMGEMSLKRLISNFVKSN